MEREEIKALIHGLISEAPEVAPSIINFETDKTYGRVTDENLDHRRAQRWQIEADTVLQQLQNIYGSAFTHLHSDHVIDKQKEVHSTSIKIHWTMQKLGTALELLDSPVATMGVGPLIRQGAPIQGPIPKPGKSGSKTETSLEPPEKVTIVWLVRHVPITGWALGAGLLVGSFLLGVRMADVQIFRIVLKAFTGEH